MKTLDAFSHQLTLPVENLSWLMTNEEVAWESFWLNPRKLRGSDFLMRWSQGLWSEHRLIHAVNQTQVFFALPYGPSGTAPSHDVREFELYFERLEAAGLGKIKRPDLLIFRRQDQAQLEQLLSQLGGISELPFISEDNIAMQELIGLSILAVECENSLWKAQQMPHYKANLTPQRRMGGKPGMKKNAVLPTVIIKEEDRKPLLDWQTLHDKPIHIWHAFYDLAFGLALSEAQRLVDEQFIEPTVQTFQAPGGSTTRKIIYKFYYHYAYPLALSQSEPMLIAASIVDKNGHILPYVRFEGGEITLADAALEVLQQAALR